MKLVLLIKTLTALALVYCAGSIALAKPVYVNVLQAAYSDAKITHRCQTCHSGSSLALNPFGKDFSGLKRELGAGQMDLVWQQLGDLDSDGDQVLNRDELVEGKSPGVSGK